MIKIGASSGNSRKSSAISPSQINIVSPSRQERPSTNTNVQYSKDLVIPQPKKNTASINANVLSDRLKNLMMQNYGDLGME